MGLAHAAFVQVVKAGTRHSPTAVNPLVTGMGLQTDVGENPVSRQRNLGLVKKALMTKALGCFLGLCWPDRGVSTLLQHAEQLALAKEACASHFGLPDELDHRIVTSKTLNKDLAQLGDDIALDQVGMRLPKPLTGLKGDGGTVIPSISNTNETCFRHQIFQETGPVAQGRVRLLAPCLH